MSREKQKMIQAGRVAFRHEGENWNAYWALPDSMEGAIFLASIRMNLVTENPQAKQAFINLMRTATTPIIARLSKGEPIWPDEPQPAPEHEKAGHS